MIANGGDEAIFDITLASNNTPFQVSPRKIQALPGKGGSGIVPLITVAVMHGVQLNSTGGIGSAPNLPKGENSTLISLKGKTLSGKDTIEVVGEFKVSVEAKVYDAQILMDGVEVKRTQRGSLGGFDCTIDPKRKIEMVNTGTEVIHVKSRYTVSKWRSSMEPLGYTPIENSIELQPNETKDITAFICPYTTDPVLQDGITSYYSATSLSFDAIGTVYNVRYFEVTTQ